MRRNKRTILKWLYVLAFKYVFAHSNSRPRNKSLELAYNQFSVLVNYVAVELTNCTSKIWKG